MHARKATFALTAALALALPVSSAADTLSVNEDASRFRSSGSYEAQLMVNNATSGAVELRATADLLDPSLPARLPERRASSRASSGWRD